MIIAAWTIGILAVLTGLTWLWGRLTNFGEKDPFDPGP